MQIGTFVHYSTKGICQVREIETMKFSSETKDYYVLVPVFDRNSKYYVPTDYDPQRIKIRSAIAPAMVEELMGYAKTCQPYEWVSNAHERKAKTEEILHSSDHKRILRLIKTLRCHEEHQKQIGKKMYLSDAKALRSALHIISDEFGAGDIIAGTPMGRFGNPEELIGAALFLASDDAAGFVNGIVLPVDGGYSAFTGV